ncbi:MAG: starvation-inducible DNA-binding protein [Paraglaciecola psychrophila]|jgi:starvation-inducible DNA-binding protein
MRWALASYKTCAELTSMEAVTTIPSAKHIAKSLIQCYLLIARSCREASKVANADGDELWSGLIFEVVRVHQKQLDE